MGIAPYLRQRPSTLAPDAMSIGTLQPCNPCNDPGYSLVWKVEFGASEGFRAVRRVQSGAPIGASMFKMERLNHSRTEVYGPACVLLPVDTSPPADKLKNVENGLNFERFDVFSEFKGALRDRPARYGEWDHSSGGLARLSPPAPAGPRKPQGRASTFSIPPARLTNRGRDSFDPTAFAAAATAPLHPPCPRVSIRSKRSANSHGTGTLTSWRGGGSRRLRRLGSGAAQPLQSDSRTCWGVQGGSNTGWEDCSTSQKLAGWQRDEEMAQ